ncbi:hypothetical protein Ga0100231_021170 [Opitutaceae bacterium TAV4]|nr:hypothetical protein Ga0100231_021170 [Opitutaceae bacterium TAV4]RRK00538.1 hypothetical protein Ga0100230_022030 [Opitutaceae bacterium TAV3]
MKAHERENAIASLKETLRPGMTIYTVLRSVSASGMSRTLDLYYVKEDKIIRITWSAAKALEWPYSRAREALRVSGGGMDMGWHTVYSLSQVVLGDGYALNHQWL